MAQAGLGPPFFESDHTGEWSGRASGRPAVGTSGMVRRPCHNGCVSRNGDRWVVFLGKSTMSRFPLLRFPLYLVFSVPSVTLCLVEWANHRVTKNTDRTGLVARSSGTRTGSIAAISYMANSAVVGTRHAPGDRVELLRSDRSQISPLAEQPSESGRVVGNSERYPPAAGRRAILSLSNAAAWHPRKMSLTRRGQVS
jgi:hypothetical protein